MGTTRRLVDDGDDGDDDDKLSEPETSSSFTKRRRKRNSPVYEFRVRTRIKKHGLSLIGIFVISLAWVLLVDLDFVKGAAILGKSDKLIEEISKIDRTLSSSVSYYEPVFYNPEELKALKDEGRARRKRSLSLAGEPNHIKFSLSTKTRDFHIHLEPDKEVFHPDLEIHDGRGNRIEEKLDPHSNVYRGYLQDDPEGSRVEGLVTREGHFDGVIETREGRVWHVEPAYRYAMDQDEGIRSFFAPGVIYEQDSVDFTPHHRNHNRNTSSTSPCASEELRKSLKSSSNSPPKSSNSSRPLSRQKRYIIDPRRRTCMLYLQADHLFLRNFGSEENVINIMARHIQRVNQIYRGTDFDGDGAPDAISFMIKRIKVHDENSSLLPDYKYNGNFQVIKFLEKFSEGDFENFCLAYMFTFRDFEGGTLGLAWTGDLKNAGGVCERKGHFRGGLKSLNTGIITLLNYGKLVLPAVSYVTLAHEVGHNFGSPHDPDNDKECVPGGRDGNYIMYARATAGDQKNNQKFSPCSLRSILPVLNAKARNVHGCFTEPQKGICGNREVEEGEECDCGWEEDCTESCCWPMRTYYPKGETPCTLKPHVECSPSQGPCCTSACRLRGGNKCREDNGCRHTAYCDGLIPQCPQSVHKPNKSICGNGQNVCFLGECTGSICLAYGLESCQCTPKPWESSGKLCELCCKKPGDGEQCLSSFELNDAPLDVPDLYAKPGSPCNNFTGYCDSYRTCREVDPSGPLATLRNLLLADEGLGAIAQWVDQHWYAVVSLVVLLVVMMILTAKLCGRQAKRKLRKITVLHSNVDAIQVERSYWDESGEHVVIHPAAVRKKIPLRKKIREKTKKGRGSRNNPRGNGEQQPPSTSKGPRYGTLWRKNNKHRRPQVSSGTSKTEQGQGEDSFDLVQLPSANANLQSQPIPTTSSSSSSTNNNINGNQLNNTPSTSSSAPVNHQYEAKTAILPTPGRGGRKQKRTHPHNQGPNKENHQGRKGTRRTSGGSKPSSKDTTAQGKVKKQSKKASPSPTKGPKKPDEVKSKKPPKSTFQIVYTPPFSVKVVHVEDKPSTSSAVQTDTELPSTSNSPGHQEVPNTSTASNSPAVPVTSKTSTASAADTKPTGGDSNSNAKVKLKKKKPSIRGGSFSSSSSFLQKRRRKDKERGELRVLIPPPGAGGECGETPTPGGGTS